MERSYDIINGIIGSRAAEVDEDSPRIKLECVDEKKSAPMKECSPKISTTSSDELMNIFQENIENEPSSGPTRKRICIEPRPPRRRETATQLSNILRVNNSQRTEGNCGGIESTSVTGNLSTKYPCSVVNSTGKQKIPRPANAFMLFANEWRKKLAIQNPRESNKDISVRLGVLWKNMAKGIKEKYFALAREVDAEHKRKYPDYVYNPKEARLRKAMREQSRELSRQSILQTAIASAAGTGNVSNSGVVTSSSFLNHPLSCSPSSGASASASASLPNSPSVNSGRIINPWFPVGPPTSSSAHLKPIISPRIMAAHQRTLEKTKEAMRKQVECATAGVFSSNSPGSSNNPSTNTQGYGNEFSNHNPAAASNNSNDYCVIAEFGDGQKWHPYQNGGNPYHNRGSSMSKVGLHQNPNIHGPWAQFCGLPLQNSAAAAAAVQNPVMRPPRQMVFLQEQQNQHCAFSDEMQMQAYVQNKIDVNPRLHSGYHHGQGDSQAKNSVSPPQMQQLQDEVKCGDGVSLGWDTGSSGTGVSSLLQDPLQQEQEEEVGTADQAHEEPRQKPNCKQPLPGFHQAFGSTEIGRFSRSEFFANMVGESSNTIPDAYLPTPVFPFSPTTQNVIGNSSMGDEDLLQMMPEECYWLGGTLSPFSHNNNIENATVFGFSLISPNYAAFLDYSHRLSSINQEWLHPGSSSLTAQEFQAAAFIDQPLSNIFHDNNNPAIFSHDHFNYGSYSYPSYDQQINNINNNNNSLNNNNNNNSNRQTINVNNGLITETNFNELIQANEQMVNSKQQSSAAVVIKQNDRICVMLEANQPQIDKDVM